MANSTKLIAVIPWSRFKWTAEAQYKQSLYTRDEAVRYASAHDCNVVVQFEKRTGPLFDVFQDPDLESQSEDDYEIVEVVPALEGRGPVRRTRSVFRGLAGLFKRSSVGTAKQEQALS